MPSRLQHELKQSKPFSSFRQELVLQLARTHAVVSHAWEQDLRRHGITSTQYNVLRILRGAGAAGLCRHEVASRLVAQVPDVSRLLDRMMLSGMVTRTRSDEDRRLVKARITTKGLGILKELDEPSVALPDRLLAHLSDDEVQTLIALLEVIRTPPDQVE